jgi:DNA primase
MIIGDGSPVLVVEAELDALLLHQEAGDLVTAAALGKAQTRPDHQAADQLSKAGLILVGLEADQAGAREAWRWWNEHYSQAHRWPPDIV